jgi:hypothetical protein
VWSHGPQHLSVHGGPWPSNGGVLARAACARRSGGWFLAVRCRRVRVAEGGSHHCVSRRWSSTVWPDVEEQSVAVMELGVSMLGASRDESGGRCRCGEIMGCSRRLFIGPEGQEMTD